MDLGISDKSLSLIGKPDLMSDMAASLRNSGMDVTPYSKDGISGFSASRSMNMRNMDENMEVPKGVVVKRTSTSTWFFTKQKLAVTIDFKQLMPENSGDWTEKLSGMSSLVKGLIGSQLDFKFLLTLPIKPGENNADELLDSGRTLVWNLELFEPNIFEAEINVPNVRNIAITAGGALVVLILCGLGYRVQRNSRKL